MMEIKHRSKIALLISFSILFVMLFILLPGSSITEPSAAAEGVAWWLPNDAADRGLVSGLSNQTQACRNIVLDASKKEAFVIEGYHYTESISSSSSFDAGYSTEPEKNIDNKTRLVLKDSLLPGAPSYGYPGFIEAQRKDGSSTGESTYFEASEQYYSYSDGNWNIPVTYKFKVKSNYLPIGKFYAVVQIAPLDGSDSWKDSAIIPFYVERNTVAGIVYNSNDNSLWDKSKTMTWSINTRYADASYFVQGYFLSGQLDGNKNPQILKEIRTSLAVPGIGTINSVYSPLGKEADQSGPSVGNLTYLATSGTSWCSQNTIGQRYPNINYDRTQTDLNSSLQKRFNVVFNDAITLTSDQLKMMKSDRDAALKITFISNTGKELLTETRTIRIKFNEGSESVVNTGLPFGDFTKPAYQFRIYEDQNEFNADWGKFRVEQGLADTPENRLNYFGVYAADPENVSFEVYGFSLSGQKDRVFSKITVFVPNSGQPFATNVDAMGSLSAADIENGNSFWNKYVPKAYDNYKYNNESITEKKNVTFKHQLKLNINKIKEATGAAEKNQKIKEIPIQITAYIINTKNSAQVTKYNLVRRVYLIKKTQETTSNSRETTIYKLQDSENPQNESWDENDIQTIDEAEWTVGNTDNSPHKTLSLSGIVNTTDKYRIVDIQAASTITGKAKALPKVVLQSVTDTTYKFSTTLDTYFEKISSGKKIVSLRIRLQRLSDNLIIPSTLNRAIKVVKLGDGMKVNPLYAIDSPAKNSTIVLPAITEYNSNSTINIPIQGTFLDGTFSGVKSVTAFWGSNQVGTQSIFTRIEQSVLDDTYGNAGYSTRFDTAYGNVYRDNFNIKFNVPMSVYNSSDWIKTGQNLVTVRVETYSRKTYTIKNTVNVKRFSDLHKPTITMINGPANSIVFSVYDVDLDLKTVEYKVSATNTSADSTGWKRISDVSQTPAEIGGGQANGTISKIVGKPYIYIKAIDKTGRIVYRKGTFK